MNNNKYQSINTPSGYTAPAHVPSAPVQVSVAPPSTPYPFQAPPAYQYYPQVGQPQPYVVYMPAAAAPVPSASQPLIVKTERSSCQRDQCQKSGACKVGLIGLFLCLCCGFFPGGFAWLIGGFWLLGKSSTQPGSPSRRTACRFIFLGIFSLIAGGMIVAFVIVPAIASSMCNDVPTPSGVFVEGVSSYYVSLGWNDGSDYCDSDVEDCNQNVQYCSVDYWSITYDTYPTHTVQGYAESYDQFVTIYDLAPNTTYSFTIQAVNDEKILYGTASEPFIVTTEQ